MIVSLLTIAQFYSKSDERYDPGGKGTTSKNFFHNMLFGERKYTSIFTYEYDTTYKTSWLNITLVKSENIVC